MRAMRTILCSIVFLTLSLGALPASAQTTTFDHPESRLTERHSHRAPRYGLLFTGASVFTASWAASIAVAVLFHDSCSCNDPVSMPMVIPVAGPFITLGLAAQSPSDVPIIPLLALLGVGEVIGAAIAIPGIVGRRVETQPTTAWSVVPMPLRGGGGVALNVTTF
jgi:hypothetical protein